MGSWRAKNGARIASVSVGFQSKKCPKNGIFEVLAAIFRAAKTSKSRSSDFFALKPHKNACYAGYNFT